MFTTGSKLYFGLAALAAAALGVLGWATGWQMQATLGAASVLIAFAFLGGLMLYIRDDETSPAAAEAPEAAPAPRHAAWALAAGFGAALAGIGMALDTRLFIVGLVIVGLSVVEWAVQSWADRASTDPVYNDRVRGRLMHPLEFPVAGLLCGGLIVFGFSRVMVALSKNGAIVVFAVVGVIVMGLAVLLGTRPKVSRTVVGGVLSVSAIIALVAGVAGIGAGERSFHPHESSCDQREVGSLTVSAKSGRGRSHQLRRLGLRSGHLRRGPQRGADGDLQEPERRGGEVRRARRRDRQARRSRASRSRPRTARPSRSRSSTAPTSSGPTRRPRSR